MEEQDIDIDVITNSKKLKEIQLELDRIKKAALFPTVFKLDEMQIKNFQKFSENHGIGKCNAFPDFTGACFTFSFMPSGLDINVWVKCSCGAKKYITDLSYLDHDDDVYCKYRKHTVYRWVCLENCKDYKNGSCLIPDKRKNDK